MNKGWQTTKLRDITTKIGSGATPLGGEEAYKNEGISLIRSLNVYDDGFRTAKLARIDQEQADNLSNVVVQPDDVLLNITGASVARCCVAPADYLPARVNQHVCIIRPIQEKLSSKFLHYLLISKIYKDRLLHTGEEGGSTRQAITKAQLQEFTIDYPEQISEQQRIVGILDEAFEGIATAKANAEKNLQNARALFESHMQFVFGQRIDGWAKRPLGECFRLKSGDGLSGKEMKAGPYPVFGGNGVTGRHNEFNLSGDNLIIGRVGALCGNVRHITERIWLTDNAFKLVDFSFKFDNAFLSYLLNFKNLRSLARQTAQPVISNSSLKDLELSFPGVLEQQRIANQLTSLSAEIERLKTIYERKIAALDELKKSLLHQAFTGQL